MYTSVNSRVASAYQKIGAESRVMGASAHELVQVLFDEFFVAMTMAREGLRNKDRVLKAKKIALAGRILQGGLLESLDMEAGGELALNLRALYNYCLQRLTWANLRDDEEALAEVVRLIEPVAQGWKQIEGEAHV